ncbi:MAG: methionyl-tRNA formyltransferase [Magnetococcales bacterium]|nr:methionyl-tRNA formyltransferase [Magnetococcales bacterium]
MMMLDSVVFLAANTARSQAYAQAMAHSGTKVNTTIYFDKAANPNHGKTAGGISSESGQTDVFMPDLDIPLLDTCKKISTTVHQITADNINDNAIQSYLANNISKFDLAIFSGFGGQIVRSGILYLGIPLLHIHSGWLPDYRGSTTTYYSLLNKESMCGVSAIILAPDIDQGPIVARHLYPLPPPGANTDYLYDSAIRADLLMRTLTLWQNDKTFPEQIQQEPEKGDTYYVIHPLLKHIALMSIGHD